MQHSDDCDCLIKQEISEIKGEDKVAAIQSKLLSHDVESLDERQSKKPRSFSSSNNIEHKDTKLKPINESSQKSVDESNKNDTNKMPSNTDHSTELSNEENECKENLNNNKNSSSSQSCLLSLANYGFEMDTLRARTRSPSNELCFTQMMVEQMESEMTENCPYLNETNDDDTDDEEQLYGRDFMGDKMIHLQNEIYCRKQDYKMAIGESSAATHVARKLLMGVFKKEVLLHCTMTGQPPRAQGRARQEERVIRMHGRAKEAIIDFSIRYAHERQWDPLTNRRNKITKAMSQKIVEIKAQQRKNDEVKE